MGTFKTEHLHLLLLKLNCVQNNDSDKYLNVAT